MSALRLLGSGVLALTVSIVLTESRALAAPHPAHATQQSSTPSQPNDEPLKVTPIPDPPRSKSPTVAATDPTLYQDTAEPKRHLVLEAALGAVAGSCLVVSVPLIQNAYSTIGSLPRREAELDAGYALLAAGGVLAIADIAIAIADAQRAHRLQKAREASSSSSQGALTIRF